MLPVDTATVASAFAEPALPVAVAVYCVVLFGLTVCIPPLPGKVKVLPSEPVMVIWVELSAVTTSVEDPPEGMITGLAFTATEGAVDRSLPENSAHPLINRGRK